jgi:hypothetical protein
MIMTEGDGVIADDSLIPGPQHGSSQETYREGKRWKKTDRFFSEHTILL